MTAIMFTNCDLKKTMIKMGYGVGQINAVIEMLNEVRPDRIKWRNQAIHWLIEKEVAVLKNKNLFLKEEIN